MKRIMTIQDISCIGKCSLTVALPIISAMGVETAIVPTAVLSTHTQFKGFTFRDLTDDMDGIREHWKKEHFRFDAIYTGYLGSERQIDIVSDYFDTFRSDLSGKSGNDAANAAGNDTHADSARPVIIMDPAMADNGKLYAGFDSYFAEKMKKLCAKADIILPNISEACLMLGEDYPGEEASEEQIRSLLLKLSELGAGICVITGTCFADGSFGFTGYDRKAERFFSYGTERIPMKSHGTGDIFASAFTGALMNGFDVCKSLCIAADYACACIKNSFNDPERVDYAVNFEAEIPYLLKLTGH